MPVSPKKKEKKVQYLQQENEMSHTEEALAVFDKSQFCLTKAAMGKP